MGGGSSEGGEGGSEAAGGQSEGEEGAPAGATFEQQVAAAQARKKAEAAKEFVRVSRAGCVHIRCGWIQQDQWCCWVCAGRARLAKGVSVCCGALAGQ